MKTVLGQDNYETIPDILPVIPTVDIVVFPHAIVPLLVLDEKIIKGINRSLQSSKMVLLLAAQNQVDSQGAIGTNDLYQVGTVASIMRLIKLPEGGIKILVQGVCKAQALELVAEEEALHAYVEKIEPQQNNHDELYAAINDIKTVTEQMAHAGYTFSPDFHIILSKMEDPEKIADFILSHLNLTVEQSQALLETESQVECLHALHHYLSKEIEIAEVQERVKNHARESMNQSQKEFYLREQLKAIKKELGEDDAEDIEIMREKLDNLAIPEKTKLEVARQINRLERTAPDSLEATVTRNYLEWILLCHGALKQKIIWI